MTATFCLLKHGENIYNGKYQIVDGLGSGYYSEVYLVERTDPKFKIRHALKIPLSHNEIVQRGKLTENVYNFSHRDPIERLYKEANILAELHHPGIVRPVDIIPVKDGRQGLLMDWLIPDSEEGETFLFGSFLKQLKGMGDYEQFGGYKVIKSVIKQLTAIVYYLQERNIIHGDIKPDNIVLRRIEPINIDLLDRTYAVLIDFEFAHSFERWDYASLFESLGISCDSCSNDSSISVPIDSDMFGTLRYSPPERFTGRIYPTYDLWAIGMMYYESLAGKHLISEDREELISILKGLSIDYRNIGDKETDRTQQRRNEFMDETQRKIREMHTHLKLAGVQRLETLEGFITNCTHPVPDVRSFNRALNHIFCGW